MAVVVPVPLALARSADTIGSLDTTAHMFGIGSPVFEPKWDGYRVCVSGGRIYSRKAVDLTRYFPDLAPVLAVRLPAGVVVDGEIVAWDVAKGRLDFTGLQARLTAGRRITAVAARRPAQLVCFDLLADGTRDLRALPLAERRRRLATLLSGLASPIVLCQQTDDPVLAQEWLTTLGAGGIEGLMIKDAEAPYPTRAGQRVWWKIKNRQTLDLLAIGVTGKLAAPTSLVLAQPAPDDSTASPADRATNRTVGATTVLPQVQARAVAPFLRPTGRTWHRRIVWGTAEPVLITEIEPLVVEVRADTAIDDGVLRHPARLIRVRADLDPTDLDADNY